MSEYPEEVKRATQERWAMLQKRAFEAAKKDLLDELLAAIGLDDYIAERVAEHERHYHGGD